MGEVPGGLPNPYCIAQVGEAFEQTNIAARSKDPVWGTRALTMIFTDLIENDLHFALVTVLHNTRASTRCTRACSRGRP